MPGKELKNIPRIAREPEFGMNREMIRDFRDYVHQSKAHGDKGSKNDKGDFTDEELREKAREFLGL